MGLIFGIVWLVFIRSGGGIEERPTDQTENGGSLPGTESGIGGTIFESTGRLPGESGLVIDEEGNLIELGTQIEISEVADGYFTKVNSLSDDQVAGVKQEANAFNYLSAEDNKFYRLLTSGEKVPLSAEEFPFVDKVTWSANGKKVVLQYPDGAAIGYDFTTGKKMTLPSGLEDPAFDVNGDNIAYKFIGQKDADNWLVVTDATENQSMAIEPIGDQGDRVEVGWSSDNRVVALYRKPVGIEREEIFFIGLNDENFKSFVAEGSNFQGVWSPKTDKILYSIVNSANNYNPSLWIVDAGANNAGSNNFSLGLITWSNKCTFSHDGKLVYCAVPINLPEAAGMYPDLVNSGPDVFYEINLASGINKMIAYPVLSENLEQFQAKQIFLSDDEKRLFFWDNFTNKVYYLRLK